jgi:mannose-6-phosphate isomerase-like protein (cupin superfamily)
MIDTGTVEFSKKDWGVCAEVICDPNFEVRHGKLKPGGFTSCHMHMHKHNMVYVSSGVVFVHLYSSEDMDCRKIAHTITLEKGDKVIIPPRVWHRLYGSEACYEADFLEIYWQAPIDKDDVITRDSGGSNPF